MSQVQHTISHLVVHKLVKEAESAAGVELRAGGCPLDDAAVRLVERLCTQYATRSSKGYGRFEDDEEAFPMPRLVREHVVDRSLDFVELSQRMMRLLQACADEEGAEAGGHVVIARILEDSHDCLWVAVVDEALGSAITGALDVVDCAYLDFAHLRAAGRIDLGGWQRGDERYISFLKGRGDVAPWFKRFLGCSDLVIALKETKKLVRALNDFAETQRLETPVRDAMLERAHDYLDGLGESRAPLALDEVARQVWPEQPERLDAALNADESQLTGGFVPDRRAIRPLVRFRAAGEQWKLEFDRSGLRSGAVHYDRASDTLVLSGLPEYLKKMLQEE
ncbi:MAG: nucleoid-associated protein [Aromatoleum sp.]|jgi:nucleoid-associated protein|uniref:nucleoid-associated protein n=1 Tax=Aromatoleum sp. TaxID=2307007 RepID=UPI002893D44B|nr:nucleoid-associated protein [Aromatoleum sp.]MDT3670876.1 nucleoid-associated protein [Aromatoleum sp.]